MVGADTGLARVAERFFSPLAGMAARTAYTVTAIALPTLANSLDVTPAAVPYLGAIIDNFAIFIAGFAVPCFLSVIVSRLRDCDPA